jgi:AraC-like DNA-binding protein
LKRIVKYKGHLLPNTAITIILRTANTGIGVQQSDMQWPGTSRMLPQSLTGSQDAEPPRIDVLRIFVFRHPMNNDAYECTLNRGADATADWSDILATRYGLHCTCDAHRSVNSTVKSWSLGNVAIARLDLTAQRFSPVREHHPNWPGNYLFVKAITAGYIDVEQEGQARRAGAGSILLLDPNRMFVESLPEPTQLVALQIPKDKLRERGFRHFLNGALIPDMKSPDVRAMSELIHCVGNQADASPQFRRRVGEQLLDLMDIILADSANQSRTRSSEAVLFRTRTFIARNLGDANLTSTTIAAAVNISANHLQRLFKSKGTSLMRYVWLARLDKAATLLSASSAGRCSSVTDIAYQCGFSNAAHFSRAFKERYGLPPREAKHMCPLHSQRSVEETTE